MWELSGKSGGVEEMGIKVRWNVWKIYSPHWSTTFTIFNGLRAGCMEKGILYDLILSFVLMTTLSLFFHYLFPPALSFIRVISHILTLTHHLIHYVQSCQHLCYLMKCLWTIMFFFTLSIAFLWNFSTFLTWFLAKIFYNLRILAFVVWGELRLCQIGPKLCTYNFWNS